MSKYRALCSVEEQEDRWVVTGKDLKENCHSTVSNITNFYGMTTHNIRFISGSRLKIYYQISEYEVILLKIQPSHLIRLGKNICIKYLR